MTDNLGGFFPGIVGHGAIKHGAKGARLLLYIFGLNSIKKLIDMMGLS
jgi:hypothetical protein